MASLDETVDVLQKRLAAFAKRSEAERLAAGWVKDENGHMIPPGWVRGPGGGSGDGAA